ncbi:MAG: DUF2892 domain-containing protein [Gemmatimonadota bacterium]
MVRNMGTTDRLLRTIAALVVAFLYFTGRINGTLGIVLLVLAAIFVLTSFIGWCPMYSPFRFSTRGAADK